MCIVLNNLINKEFGKGFWTFAFRVKSALLHRLKFKQIKPI